MHGRVAAVGLVKERKSRNHSMLEKSSLNHALLMAKERSIPNLGSLTMIGRGSTKRASAISIIQKATSYLIVPMKRKDAIVDHTKPNEDRSSMIIRGRRPSQVLV